MNYIKRAITAMLVLAFMLTSAPIIDAYAIKASIKKTMTVTKKATIKNLTTKKPVKPIIKPKPISKLIKPTPKPKPINKLAKPTPKPTTKKLVSKSNLFGISNILFKLKSVEGARYTSNEIFEVNKLTMINFWGTTCTPCIQELPDLQALNDELAKQKFGIMGIVGDVLEGDDRETAKAIVDKKKLSFPNLLPDKNMNDTLISKMSGFPVSIFVDKSGNIVGDVLIGTKSKEEYKKIIENLLAVIK